VCEFYV